MMGLGLPEIFMLSLMLFIIIVPFASFWLIFEKAGRDGWIALIPFYNYYTLLEIVGRPTWWLLLMFIPFLNVVFGIIVIHSLSLSFGKSAGFTIGILFLSFIFIPVLAFGDSQYIGNTNQYNSFQS